nr:MFS transporter [Opitutaceae bacterium]
MITHVQDTPSSLTADRTTRWALTGLSLSMLMSSLGSSIANVSLPALALAFTARFQAVQWVILAYLLPISALIVSAGRLGDLFGRRRMLAAGIALFVIASAACAVAPTLWLLIVARVAQGTGAAAMMALTLASVGETVPRSQMGRAMGLLGTMSAVGTALGPSLGGALIASFGWHSIFLVNIPLGIAALVIVGRHLPPDQGHTLGDRPAFDQIGTILLAAALAAYALAMTTARGHFGAMNLILLAVAATASTLFVVVESRVDKPLVQIRLIREPLLRSSLLASAFVSTVMMTTLVVGPFYLSLGLGLGSSAVGLTLSVGPIIAALAGIPAGQLTDRLGSQRIAIIGLLGLAAGAACLAFLPTTHGVFGYLMPIVVLTAGYALFQTANNTVVMAGVSEDMRGVVSGLLNLSRNLGLVTGASAMGAVFA